MTWIPYFIASNRGNRVIRRASELRGLALISKRLVFFQP